MGLPRADLPRNLRALAYALDFVGLGEVGGENRGPLVELTQRAAGIPPGSPWCAGFVNFCVELGCAIASERSPLEEVPLQGLVQSYVDHATDAGWLADGPAPGDLFAIRTGRTGRYDHIGFVSRIIDGKSIGTVEGNTNTAGGREGDGVYQRVRGVGGGLDIVFIRWWEDDE